MPLRLLRLGHAGFPVWSGEGARQFGARWNPPGLPAIYCGTSYAIAVPGPMMMSTMSTP